MYSLSMQVLQLIFIQERLFVFVENIEIFFV